MERISNELIAQVIGVSPCNIGEREDIYVIEDNRRFEKVKVLDRLVNGFVFVKYGTDDRILNEIMIYQFFIDCNVDKTPKLLGQMILQNGLHILALEWVEGEHPDLTGKESVKRVFHELGVWAASWSLKQSELFSNQLQSKTCQDGNQQQINSFFIRNMINKDDIEKLFSDVSRTAKNIREELREYSDEAVDEVLIKINSEFRAIIIDNIFRMPVTLDPGDISLHNVFMNKNNKSITFIDFESAKFKPLALMMEYIGEEYGSIPNGDLAEYA